MDCTDHVFLLRKGVPVKRLSFDVKANSVPSPRQPLHPIGRGYDKNFPAVFKAKVRPRSSLKQDTVVPPERDSARHTRQLPNELVLADFGENKFSSVPSHTRLRLHALHSDVFHLHRCGIPRVQYNSLHHFSAM